MEPGTGVQGGFIVELDRFHGPLDLLLHLIREQDIDVFDIPIARITAQFLRIMEGVEALGIDRAGEFLEMAALLVRIKVQMLLPRPGAADGDPHDPRAELVRRLLEYEHFREAAQRLELAEAERARLFRRGYVPARARPTPPAELEVVWNEVWAAALGLEERLRPPADHLVTSKVVPMEEKIELILESLGRLERIELRQLVAPFADRVHTVVTFMAGLELARRRDLAVRQTTLFAPVWFFRRPEEELDAAQPDR